MSDLQRSISRPLPPILFNGRVKILANTVRSAGRAIPARSLQVPWPFREVHPSRAWARGILHCPIGVAGETNSHRKKEGCFDFLRVTFVGPVPCLAMRCLALN